MTRRIFMTAALCMASCFARAQEQGGIVGTIRDQAGAVVSGAKVTVTNTETSQTRTVTTTSAGDFSTPNLPVGVYSLIAEQNGFKRAVADNIKVDVQQTRRIDVTLQVGSTNEKVTVTSAAPQLQTQNAEISALVENKRVEELPLNGRNFTQLALLVPGVTGGTDGNYEATYGLGPRGTGVAFSVNGQQSSYNEFLVDGVPAKENQHESNSFSPSIDAIQEFRVQTSNYSAEFGTEAGAQINLATKSGTNGYHGSLYEFLRNDLFDGSNYFSGGVKPELRQNQYGGTLGGPIRKNKTFFFGSYEGTRILKGLTQTALVPNQQERTGDFSDLLQIPQSEGGPITILNPLTSTAFPRNVINVPLSPVATYILQNYVPLPNIGPVNQPFDPLTATPNYVSNDTNKIYVYQVIGRVDHHFSEHDTMFGRYTIEDVTNISPKLFPTDSFQQKSRGQNAEISYDHIFSAEKLNEFRLAYNRFRQNETVGNAFHNNVVGTLGIQGLCELPACWGVPEMNVGPFIDFGEHGLGQVVSGPRGWHPQVYHLSDTFSYIRGPHTIKFGTTFERHLDSFPEIIFPRGIFTFDGRFSDGVAADTPNNGSALADYLLGLPENSLASINEFNPHLANNDLYPWIQDDWRITPTLTLNLGLRYEWSGRPISQNNTIANVDFSKGVATLVTPQNREQLGYPRALINGENHDFAPRLGFAWNPAGQQRFVMRSGYGWFYQRETSNSWEDLAINPPFINQTSFNLTPADVPNFSLQNPFALAPPIPLLVFAMEKNWRDGYVQEWNLDTQYAVTPHLVADIGYVGNKGTKLPDAIPINQAVPGADPNPQDRRPYQNFGSITYRDSESSATYNGLQARLERRFSNGLSFLGAYTFSRTINDQSLYETDTGGPQNIRDLAAEKGLAAQDVRHRFVMSYVYELPFGRGKHFGSEATGVVGQLIGGWQVNGITTFQTGQPFTALMGFDNANVGDGVDRPNQVGDPTLPRGQRTVTHWFNTAAFVAAPFGTFGNAARNNIIGPGLNNFDFSALKSFVLSEQKRLEFRTEIFDIFNHTNFSLFSQAAGSYVGNVINTGSFGQLSNARDPRVIQFGLKFLF
jgi:Carboxypeptidase regulatory-like domain/TonB-dependent Receptor Plug Domain